MTLNTTGFSGLFSSHPEHLSTIGKSLHIPVHLLEAEYGWQEAVSFIVEDGNELQALKTILHSSQKPLGLENLKISCISSGDNPSAVAQGLATTDHIKAHAVVAYQEIYSLENGAAWGSWNKCRLGLLKENIFYAEPWLRESDLLIIDLNSVKKADCPYSTGVSPFGLTMEELCQLMYFASNGRCEFVFLHGLRNWEACSERENLQRAEALRHLTYYFLKGREQRKYANMEAEMHTKEIHVQLDQLEDALIFVQNELTNKWWFKSSSLSSEQTYLACHAEDYEMAKAGVLSDFIMGRLGE